MRGIRVHCDLGFVEQVVATRGHVMRALATRGNLIRSVVLRTGRIVPTEARICVLLDTAHGHFMRTIVATLCW